MILLQIFSYFVGNTGSKSYIFLCEANLRENLNLREQDWHQFSSDDCNLQTKNILKPLSSDLFLRLCILRLGAPISRASNIWHHATFQSFTAHVTITSSLISNRRFIILSKRCIVLSKRRWINLAKSGARKVLQMRHFMTKK